MSRNPNRTSTQAAAAMALIGVSAAFLAWTDQSLSFPLGGHDQGWLAAVVRGEAPTPESSWIAPAIDRLAASLAPRPQAYLVLEVVRRWLGILALLGLIVWVGRTVGWVRAAWVAVLGLAFLPLRLVCASLQPHAYFLSLFCWGCCLAFGRPWSKTGTAEQWGGGVLLGASAFAAPLGFLFLTPIGLRALVDAKYRRILERPFWLGGAIGILPGLFWAMGEGRDFGVRMGTWRVEKASGLYDLAVETIGWVHLAPILIGALVAHRYAGPMRREALDLFWPSMGILVLGEADPLRASLAAPGILLLGMIGFETIGKVFVARKEQALIPTILVFGLSYHLFFSGLPSVRDRQAHAREVGSLAQLILTRVPPEAPVCLFRLNPLVDCLEALFPPRKWREVDSGFFRVAEGDEAVLEEILARWVRQTPEIEEIWVDPKRMGEPVAMGGAGDRVRSVVLEEWAYETYHGEHGSELARVLAPPVRGKKTPIP